MAKKLPRQRAMVEVLDGTCPAGPWLTYADAVKIAAACEAVAVLYEQSDAAKMPTRQQAMIEVLDEMRLACLRLTSNDAVKKIAAACEAVAALYMKGGALQQAGPLGFAVRPASLRKAFQTAMSSPANQHA